MCDVVKKMRNEVPKSFVWFNVLLSAHFAVASIYLGIAVQTVFFLPFLKVRHVFWVLLNKQRNAFWVYKKTFLVRLVNIHLFLIQN